MAKLTLEQIDSLIDDDKMTEAQLDSHMSEGFSKEEIQQFFMARIEAVKDESENLDEEDDGFN